MPPEVLVGNGHLQASTSARKPCFPAAGLSAPRFVDDVYRTYVLDCQQRQLQNGNIHRGFPQITSASIQNPLWPFRRRFPRSIAKAIEYLAAVASFQAPSIPPVSSDHERAAREFLRRQIKPRSALGRIEDLACRLAGIQKTRRPTSPRCRLLLFCADHGVAVERVSAMDPGATVKLVELFASGKAAVNAICHATAVNLEVVDMGTSTIPSIPTPSTVVSRRIGNGTQNIRYSPAMSPSDCLKALMVGLERANAAADDGYPIIALGETGIANTTSASALLSVLAGWAPDETVGRGTGVTGSAYARKKRVVRDAVVRSRTDGDSTVDHLAQLAGFEIVAMVGAILGGAARELVVIVDGFAASVSALAAKMIVGRSADYLVFAHLSRERAHARLLLHMSASPILNLQMGLGEGTGAALAYPMVAAAALLLRELDCESL